MKCGKYKHFKGQEYIAYGTARTLSGEEFVLYRQNYGLRLFWIRPIEMFYDKVSNDSGEPISRFKFIHKINPTELMKSLADTLKKESLIIKHSETKDIYKFVSLDEESECILISEIDTHSSYLTDSQLAYRMGYDLYNVNKKLTINETCVDLPEEKKLSIISVNSDGQNLQAKDIIKDQINPCSVDLHISDEFYRPKCKMIDMANATHYSAMPQAPWKRVFPFKINGRLGVILWPKQTLVTYTLEKLCLPKDCAGKIEIKSTYARLSLSVTASDFCNPGWRGHFPLTIKNNGNHIIVLHPKERMLQLSLVPTEAPIIRRYSQKGVFMDDAGTPFNFWRSQTVKRISSELNPERLLQFSENALIEIEETSNDVEGEQERFKKTFLRFCQKKLTKPKYFGIKDEEKRICALWDAYKKREKNLKFFFSKPVKFSIPGIPLLIAIAPNILEWAKAGTVPLNMTKWSVILLIFSVLLALIVFFKTPSCYCSFEKLEFKKIYNRNQDLEKNN